MSKINRSPTNPSELKPPLPRKDLWLEVDFEQSPATLEHTFGEFKESNNSEWLDGWDIVIKFEDNTSIVLNAMLKKESLIKAMKNKNFVKSLTE